MRRIHASTALVGRRAAAAAAERAALYRRLLAVTQASLRQAEAVRHPLEARVGDAVQRARAQVTHFVPLVQQVCAQTQRRVLEGEAVPAADKLVSLVERHTAVIRRGKLATPTQFGTKIMLDEVDERVVVTAPQVATYLKSSYPTAAAALSALSGLGMIEAVADTYPQRWIARELLDCVYE